MIDKAAAPDPNCKRWMAVAFVEVIGGKMATMIFDGAEYDIRWEIIDPILGQIEAATMPGGFTTIESSFDSGDVNHFVWTPGVPITFKCKAKEMLLRLGRL